LYSSLLFNSVCAQPIQLIPEPTELPPIVDSLPTSGEATGFWEGTPPSILEDYLTKLPIHLSSPVLQSMRSIIFKEKYAPLQKNQIYEELMFSFMIQTGKFDEAKNFLEESTLPEKESERINLQWLAGESKKACEKIANLIRTSPDHEWKRQNIYCLYLNGEVERGKIAAELLSESQSDETEPDEFQFMNALFDSNSKPPFSLSIAASSILLNVWITTGQEMSEDALKILFPSQLSLIARSEKMPFKTRLWAASKAIQEGTINSEVMENVLKKAPSDDLLVAFDTALKSPKSEELLPLFKRATSEHKLDLVGLTFKSMLSKIEPNQENLMLAPYMIRAYFAVGEKDLTKKWGALFMREAPDEAIGVLPVLHLAFPEIKWGESQFQAWQIYQNRINPETSKQRAAELQEILKVVGENQEPEKRSWRQEKALFDGKTMELFDSAVQSKRKGEILLLFLDLIGDTPLSEIPSDKFTRLVSALRNGGYPNEARALALEYLLAKGI